MDIHYLLSLEDRSKFLEALEILDQHESELGINFQILKARLLYQISQREEATKLVDILLKNRHNYDNEETQIELVNLKIETLLDNNDYQNIDEKIAIVLELVSSSDRSNILQNKLCWGKFLLQMGNLHAAKSAYLEATDTYLKSLKIFKQLEAIRYEAKVSSRLGTAYRLQSRFDKAEKYLSKALKLSRMISNEYDEAEILNRLGAVYLSNTSFDKAEECFEKSIKYYELNYNPYELKKVYSNLGIVYRRKGDYPRAVEEFKKGLEIAYTLNDVKAIFSIHLNVGNIHIDNGDLDLAFSSYIKGFELVDQITDKRAIAILESNLGIIYQKRGQYVEALRHYEISMDIHKQIKNEKGITKIYHNVGKIYRLQGDLLKALPHFEYSLKLRKKMKDIQGMTWDLQYIGMIYFELAKYEKAKKMFEECYSIRKKIANKITLSEILFLSISVYVILGLEELVQSKFDELTEIHNTVESSIVDNHFLLSKIKMEQSNRIMKKVLENELYEEILKKNVIDIEHTQVAETGHCNFLLLDYKSSNDEESLIELKNLIVGLYDKVRNQENHHLLVEILLIEARLVAIQEDYTMSSKFLKYAADIAENKNLVKLKLDISLAEEEIRKDSEKTIQFTGVVQSFPQPNETIVDDYVDMLRENIEYEYESAIIFATDEKEIIEANLKFAELISKDPELPPETNDALHFLELSLWDYRLLTTTYNLIQRLENNAYYSHPQSFDMHDLLQSRLQVFKQKQVIRKINLIDDQAHDNLELEVDKNLIVVIIDNLLQNVMKFTPEKGIVEIKISKEESELHIEFSNDCRELHDWVVPRLFKRFGQWQFDDQTRKLGVGIGLTFVQSAVNYLGGSVEFISPIPDETGGTLIKIIIPIQI